MSMISSQCDKLRETASKLDSYDAYGNIASMLREAADTIWQLRNKCSSLVDGRERLFRANVEKNGEILRLVGENAKLREELADAPSCDACEAMLDCDECLRADSSQKERRRLEADNAKLRKLVGKLIKVIRFHGGWYELWVDVARELGVEVD